jgi:hypothetical protein
VAAASSIVSFLRFSPMPSSEAHNEGTSNTSLGTLVYARVRTTSRQFCVMFA